MKNEGIRLEAELQDSDEGVFLSVSVHNETKQAVTFIGVARYLVMELKDESGQFVRGQELSTALNLPSTKDYVSLKKGAAQNDVVRVPLTRTQVGSLDFGDVPRENTVRITYKADGMMPGLPSHLRRQFVSGPTTPITLPVTLPERTAPADD